MNHKRAIDRHVGRFEFLSTCSDGVSLLTTHLNKVSMKSKIATYDGLVSIIKNDENMTNDEQAAWSPDTY
jgi:hypothetical protein